MNYMKIYNDLVNNARLVCHNDDAYTEIHHIVMKSLGGSNAKENLVEFTARQHYIAHLLLYKHYKSEMLLGKDKTPYYKALYALHAMIQFPATKDDNGLTKRIFKFGSKLYQRWKIDLSKKQSELSKTRIAKLKNDPIKYKEYRNKLSNGVKAFIDKCGPVWIGRHHSDDTKKKMSELRYDGHSKNNSMFGYVWISNIELKISINVPIDMLYDYIANGWIKRRIINWQSFLNKSELEKYHLLNCIKSEEDKNLVRQNKLTELIQKKINKQQNKIQKRENDIKQYQKMYEFYLSFGWEETIQKFDYQYSYQNFYNRCKKLLQKCIAYNK